MKKIIINDKKVAFAESQEDLGDIFGFTRQYVAQKLKEGAPQETFEGFNCPDWHQWLLKRSKSKDKADSPLKQANLLYRQEKAKITKLERETMQGKLVDRKQFMEAEIFRLAELSQTFRRLPSCVSARAANKSAPEVLAIVDAEVRRILKYFEDLYSGKIEIESEKQIKSKAGRKTKIEKASQKGRVII